jgi:hypothetical protein
VRLVGMWEVGLRRLILTIRKGKGQSWMSRVSVMKMGEGAL